MPDPDLTHPLDPATRAAIRRKATQIARQVRRGAQDGDDFEQDLTLELWQRLKRHDPSRRERAVFVRMILRRATSRIIRDLHALKRDDRSVGSLDAPVATGDENHPVDARSRFVEDVTELAIDVAEVLARLPPELRDLAVRLQTQSVSGIARELGIPRTTLSDRKRRLRARLEELGLRN